MTAFAGLPVRVLPLPDESLPGLVVRSAGAMAYDQVELLTRLLERPHPHESLLLLAGPPLERLARLLRQPVAELQQRTAHPLAARLVLPSTGGQPPTVLEQQAVLQRYLTLTTAAVCPSCLATDPIPYERLRWHFRALPLCLPHGRLLLTRCPACRRPFPSLRPAAATCVCGQSLRSAATPAVAPPAQLLARQLAAWIDDTPAPTATLSPAVRFWLLERLRCTVRQLPILSEQAAARYGLDPQAHRAALGWLAAAAVLHPWPAGLEAFLATYQELLTRSDLRAVVNRAFTMFFRATVALEARGQPEPARCLRQYLVEKHGTSYLTPRLLLFRAHPQRHLLVDRPWCTQASAAARLGVSGKIIRSLLARGLLVGQVHAVSVRGRALGLVLQASVDTLRQQLQAGLGLAACQRRLGLGRSQLLELVHTAVLSAAVRTRQGWRILPQALTSLEQLLERLPCLPATGTWLTLRQATRSYSPCGLNLARALNLVQAGQVAACRDAAQPGLRGVYLSAAALQRSLPQLQEQFWLEGGYPLRIACRRLVPGHPLKEVTLRKWIAAGLLEAQRLQRNWRISAAAMTRFHETWCLAAEVCSRLGISRQTLSTWEARGRLRAVYSRRTHAGAGASLYRRTDLAGLARQRCPVPRKEDPCL